MHDGKLMKLAFKKYLNFYCSPYVAQHHSQFVPLFNQASYTGELAFRKSVDIFISHWNNFSADPFDKYVTRFFFIHFFKKDVWHLLHVVLPIQGGSKLKKIMLWSNYRKGLLKKFYFIDTTTQNRVYLANIYFMNDWLPFFIHVTLVHASQGLKSKNKPSNYYPKRQWNLGQNAWKEY